MAFMHNNTGVIQIVIIRCSPTIGPCRIPYWSSKSLISSSLFSCRDMTSTHSRARFHEDNSSTAAQSIYTPDRMSFKNQLKKCNVSFRIRPPAPPPLIKSSRFFFQSRGTKRYVIDQSTNNRLDGVNIIIII